METGGGTDRWDSPIPRKRISEMMEKCLNLVFGKSVQSC